jgi:RNA polymerase sigma-70 factor (ECF subfamily)
MGWNNISHYWRRWVGEEASEQLAQSYQQQRSPAALQQLFLRYADALYYFLRQQSNAQLAEDISQQTWLQFMQIQSAMPPYQSFKAWLFAVARHALIDEFRRQGRWQYTELGHDGERDATQDAALDATHDASCLHEDTADPAVMLQQAESMAVLDAAIAALPLVQKEALLLQLEGFSLHDIASITQSTPETVKSRLRYAKSALARQLNSTSTPSMSASVKATAQHRG